MCRSDVVVRHSSVQESPIVTSAHVRTRKCVENVVQHVNVYRNVLQNMFVCIVVGLPIYLIYLVSYMCHTKLTLIAVVVVMLFLLGLLGYIEYR